MNTKIILILLMAKFCQSFNFNNVQTNFKKIAANSLLLFTFTKPVDAFPIFQENYDNKIEKSEYKSLIQNNQRNTGLYDLQNQMKLPEITKTYVTVNGNNVYFYGQVTADSCRILGEKIKELNENAIIFKTKLKENPPPINLHIQSPGGSLMNTFYLIDLINSIETPVNTYVDGYAASAASLISVVGKKRYMTQNSLILIHQLSGGNEGKFEELDDDMKNMNLFMNIVKKIYLSKTNIKPFTLDDMLKHDIWLSSDQCKELGLVDEII